MQRANKATTKVDKAAAVVMKEQKAERKKKEEKPEAEKVAAAKSWTSKMTKVKRDISTLRKQLKVPGYSAWANEKQVFSKDKQLVKLINQRNTLQLEEHQQCKKKPQPQAHKQRSLQAPRGGKGLGPRPGRHRNRVWIHIAVKTFHKKKKKDNKKTRRTKKKNKKNKKRKHNKKTNQNIYYTKKKNKLDKVKCIRKTMKHTRQSLDILNKALNQ